MMGSSASTKPITSHRAPMSPFMSASAVPLVGCACFLPVPDFAKTSTTRVAAAVELLEDVRGVEEEGVDGAWARGSGGRR